MRLLLAAFVVLIAAPVYAVPITASPMTFDPNEEKVVLGDIGFQGFFWDFSSGQSLTAMRSNFIGAGPDFIVAPDRTYVSTAVDYPNGSGHNTQSNSSGLFALLGADAASVSGGGDVGNITTTGHLLRGFLNVTSDMDLSPGGDINIQMQVSSDDDANIVFGGGFQADGQNFVRSSNHSLEFAEEGVYEFAVIHQENSGATGFTLFGSFANLNGGAQTVLDAAAMNQLGAFFQTASIEPLPLTPEPGTLALFGVAIAAMAGSLHLKRRRS